MTEPHPEHQTQQTQPKKGEPVEIPVPDRESVLADLKKLGGVKRGTKSS